MDLRNNKPVIRELEKVLLKTDNDIDAIDNRLLNEKLSNAKFQQLFIERHALMVKRRQSLRKLELAKSGNPWGVVEEVVK